MEEYQDTLYQHITSLRKPEDILEQKTDILQGFYRQSRRGSYEVAGHYQHNPDAYLNAKKEKAEGKPFRKEEWMCKLCMDKSFPIIGKIVDYQVPLKHTRGGDCKGMGKVDLLSVNEDTAWLLELKVPDSTESPLRAILEVYTYWRQLGGEQCQYFLERSKARGAGNLKKAIVIFEKGADASPKYLYRKLEKDWMTLSELMRILDVACFVAELKNDDPDCDEIVGIHRCIL